VQHSHVNAERGEFPWSGRIEDKDTAMDVGFDLLAEFPFPVVVFEYREVVYRYKPTLQSWEPIIPNRGEHHGRDINLSSTCFLLPKGGDQSNQICTDNEVS